MSGSKVSSYFAHIQNVARADETALSSGLPLNPTLADLLVAASNTPNSGSGFGQYGNVSVRLYNLDGSQFQLMYLTGIQSNGSGEAPGRTITLTSNNYSITCGLYRAPIPFSVLKDKLGAYFFTTETPNRIVWLNVRNDQGFPLSFLDTSNPSIQGALPQNDPHLEGLMDHIFRDMSGKRIATASDLYQVIKSPGYFLLFVDILDVWTGRLSQTGQSTFTFVQQGNKSATAYPAWANSSITVKVTQDATSKELNIVPFESKGFPTDPHQPFALEAFQANPNNRVPAWLYFFPAPVKIGAAPEKAKTKAKATNAPAKQQARPACSGGTCTVLNTGLAPANREMLLLDVNDDDGWGDDDWQYEDGEDWEEEDEYDEEEDEDEDEEDEDKPKNKKKSRAVPASKDRCACKTNGGERCTRPHLPNKKCCAQHARMRKACCKAKAQSRTKSKPKTKSRSKSKSKSRSRTSKSKSRGKSKRKTPKSKSRSKGKRKSKRRNY